MGADFVIYPALDLRGGQVVRLQNGDPHRETVYGSDPGAVAERWLSAGARWLHVVNMDAAFGDPDDANRRALRSVFETAARFGVKVQLGGGLRSVEAVEQSFDAGVERVVLGTAAVEQPELLRAAIQRWGGDRVAVALDARDGFVCVRGWAQGSAVRALDLAEQQKEAGARWLIFTDISRDGAQTGVNWQAAAGLAQATGLNVIASGGVKAMEDVRTVRRAGLSGVIVGRALYDGALDVHGLFTMDEKG